MTMASLQVAFVLTRDTALLRVGSSSCTDFRVTLHDARLHSRFVP
jgi:hypothetical protein